MFTDSSIKNTRCGGAARATLLTFSLQKARSPRAAATALVATAFAAALVAPGAAEAATYRVRSVSVGQATQFLRSDRSVAAPRRVTQFLSLSATDLGGEDAGGFSAQLSVRYFSDFGLPERLRQEPRLSDGWNTVSLELGYLDWRPLEALHLRLGRQWAVGTLGVRDFDGLHVRFAPGAGRLRPLFELYGGRDVQLDLAPFASSTFDVQGLPPNDPAIEHSPNHWLVGAEAGLEYARRATLRVGYQQRFRPQEPLGGLHSDAPQTGVATGFATGFATGERRVGAAASAAPHRRVVVHANVAYHTLLQGFDHLGLSAAWRLPWPAHGVSGTTLSAGYEQRRPIFDSASIFNLFGAQPHQSLYVAARHPVDAWSTDFELRLWSRLYIGDGQSPGLARFATDAQAFGAAVGHRSRLRFDDRPVEWHTRLSHQTSTDPDYSGDQFLGESGARVPVFGRRAFVSGRGLWLVAWQPHDRHEAHRPDGRRSPATAGTAVAGLDVPIGDVALLSVALASTVSSHFGGNTSAYVTLEIEAWP